MASTPCEGSYQSWAASCANLEMDQWDDYDCRQEATRKNMAGGFSSGELVDCALYDSKDDAPTFIKRASPRWPGSELWGLSPTAQCKCNGAPYSRHFCSRMLSAEGGRRKAEAKLAQAEPKLTLGTRYGYQKTL